MSRHALLAVVLALAACEASETSPDHTPTGDLAETPTATPCTAHADCAFGQRCDGGVCALELPASEGDDGCSSDADCAADEACAPSTGRCLPLPQNPTPGVDAERSCDEGAARACGSKLGQCSYGTQLCLGGAWSACEGDVGPTAERCNGLDDDCDGAVPPSELDQDGDGVPECAGDCAPLDNAAAPGRDEVCDGKDNDCDGATDEDPLALCDDGIYCNGAETCSAGACIPGAAVQCGGLSSACADGVCNELARGCEARRKFDGTPCDDGQFCTNDTVCSAGVCGGGTARDCSALDGLCVVGTCDETADTCAAAPRPNGTSCESSTYCYVGETCQAGVCQGGALRGCSGSGSCTIGTCNPTTDRCEGTPVADGTPCDDGVFCTTNDTCSAGACGGGPRDCSAAGNTCNRGVCDAATDSCRTVPYGDGRACDDGAYCSVGDTCRADGTCGGALRDCSSVANACNAGACNESTDTCQPVPRNEGLGCNDGQYCSVNDVCVAGSCQGAARSCASLSDACNLGACNESADACERQPRAAGTVCDDGQFCTVNDACSAGACLGGPPRDCSGVAAPPCTSGACDEAQNRCVQQDTGVCVCDRGVDADFDGANACDDCDDTNGSVHPGAAERCNGIDDDCDGRTDEDFDADSDTYSVCAVQPDQRDCDDTRPLVNPGAPEACGPGGTGNGLDDNCNGYIDEGCAPCDAVDRDGDGRSQCQGDCAPSDGAIYPGASEQCDGKDNDCNVFTTENCGVSDPCNWPSGADTCRSDLLCACTVNNRGECSGNYLCTSLCNTSGTGPVGDGCDVGQSCYYDLLRSANVHGCAERETTLGLKVGGVACSADSECRSGNCAMLFSGPGQKSYCYDYCGSDAYCAATGTVCRVSREGSSIDGRCWPTGRPGVGAKSVGQTCTADSECDHGLCTSVDGGATKVCTEACCKDADCGAGFTCGLRGDSVTTSYVTVPPSAPACTATAQCPTGMECFTSEGKCAWRLAETSPMCVPDAGGQGTRRAGAACSGNSDCASAFCERSLGVCVDVCCNDDACPTGLACELMAVQSLADRVVNARVCVNSSVSGVLLRK